MNLNQVTLPVRDLPEAVGFYKKMGFRQIVDSPHYARFESIEGDATFSLHLADARLCWHGVVIYFETEQLDRRVQELVNQGFRFFELPTDKKWLWREARLKDPSGNEICLYWAGENRKNPPWRVTET
jgi:catechol 2,3-dioxygenase-like lactoylglutathione lyase family enzyme